MIPIFYCLWFDPTGNRTRVYRFSSRRSIHSTTDRCEGRPRGHILKSLALALASKVKSLALALASKVKSLALASKPQVLENCPVLGSRTALFFEQLKFRWKTPETLQKICEHLFCFPHLEHRRSQGEGGWGSAPFPIEISPMTKM